MRPAALFDVDGTLITTTSLFSFLRSWFAVLGRPAEDYQRFRATLAAMTASGVPREQTNRSYFRAYAGHDAAAIAEHGRRWFAEEAARGGLFHDEVLSRLREHAADGSLVVLVSGSFPACLDPIRERIRPDVLICSRPVIRDGVYTGEVEVPMIGEAKAHAVRRLAAERGLDLGRSYAYGDHLSDLPILRCVGHPVQVGGDEALTVIARTEGWPVVPAARRPGRPAPAPRPSPSRADAR